MITLNLEPVREPYRMHGAAGQPLSLVAIERDLERAFESLALLVEQAHAPTIYLPSEVLMQAVDDLMPAERMGVMAGRIIGRRTVLGGMQDVTGRASRAHVYADPQKLGRALMNFEYAGASLLGWIHSHPGTGPGATTPSITDLAQYEAWTRDYAAQLVGLIVVRDGYVRLWGQAVESGAVRVEMVGLGIDVVKGHRHVYKLQK